MWISYTRDFSLYISGDMLWYHLIEDLSIHVECPEINDMGFCVSGFGILRMAQGSILKVMEMSLALQDLSCDFLTFLSFFFSFSLWIARKMYY